MTLRFYARSNVVGDYYITFVSGWPTNSYPRATYRKYTINTANEWNLIEIGLSGDTSNEQVGAVIRALGKTQTKLIQMLD